MPQLLARFVERFTANKAAESLRDWPNELRLNAAAARLAPYLYAAHNEIVQGGEPMPWPTLHPAIRHVWTQRAAFALRTVR